MSNLTTTSPTMESTKFHSNPDLSSRSADINTHNINTRKRRDARESDFDELSRRFEEWKAEMNKCIISTIQSTVSAALSDKLEVISTSLVQLRGDVQKISTDNTQINNSIVDLRQKIVVAEKASNLSGTRMKEMEKELMELKKSVAFTSDRQDDLYKSVDNMKSTTEASNQSQELVASLELKVDSLEQNARMCNIEVCNVPDRQGENLVSLIECIGSAINYTIQQKDIAAVHRVPHFNQQTKTPKNIIVKFTSRMLRDNILGAYKQKKGLTTVDIGISGTTNSIYMHEHLTLKKKNLFRECREWAKTNKYRYVWTSNATILVRESDNSPISAVHKLLDLANIKNKIRATTSSKHVI